eukprot:6205082-Pleurochrysis_carterae.AAC.1
MEPEPKNREREGRQKAVVEGISRSAGAEGAVVLPWERSNAKKNEGAPRRRRRVRERFCGDSVCAPGWLTFGTSAAFLSVGLSRRQSPRDEGEYTSLLPMT